MYKKFITNQWHPAEIVDALFEDFDITYPPTDKEGAQTILYLYRLRYLQSDNQSFTKSFDKMLQDASEYKLDASDMKLLPEFVAGHTSEDIRCFFKSVASSASGIPDLTALLSDLGEAMNTICDCSGDEL